MNLQQLEYLAAINRCGSITNAATECHITQQAVSNAIKSLEKELGVQLLIRTPSGTQLSPECNNMINSVRKVLEGCNEIKATASLSAHAEGTIRLALAKRIVISNGPRPNLLDLEEFEKSHPAIHLEKFTTASDGCYSMVEHKMADLAIAVGVKDSAKFSSTLLSSKEAVILTSAQSHLVDFGEMISFKDLSQETFVAPPDLGESFRQIVNACQHHGYDPRFYMGDLVKDDLFKTVIAHNLVFVIPIDMAEKHYLRHKEEGLEPVIIKIAPEERFSLERRLVWRAGEELSPAAVLLKTYLEGLAEV